MGCDAVYDPRQKRKKKKADELVGLSRGQTRPHICRILFDPRAMSDAAMELPLNSQTKLCLNSFPQRPGVPEWLSASGSTECREREFCRKKSFPVNE